MITNTITKLEGRILWQLQKDSFAPCFIMLLREREIKLALNAWKSRVGNSKMTRAHSNQKAVYARTVVVYVRLTDRTGDLIFHARYG